MSIKLMSAIWDHGPERQAARFVLLALADYAGEDGACWPSMETIAAKCCMTPRGVRQIVRTLEKEGWLTIQPGGGRNNTNLYLIHENPERQTLNGEINPERHAGLNGINPERGSPEPLREELREERAPLYIPPDFDAFWEIYPRCIAKGAARRAWAGAVKKARPDDIMAAASEFAEKVMGKDPKYIPHPATWLNGERWEDKPEANGYHCEKGDGYDKSAVIKAAVRAREQLGGDTWC